MTPVVLSAADPAGTVAFVRRLQDAAGQAAPIAWSGRVELDETLLHHLPPPAGCSAAWRDAYRPALFHYRRGPGFVLVTDHRSGTAAATTLPDEPFLTFATGAPIGDQDVAHLVEAGLLLRVGDHAITAPYRLRRWPIPCTAV